MSAMTLPVSSKSTWATNRLSRLADGIGESQLTTVMPASTVLRRRVDLVAGVVRDHDGVDALGHRVGDELDLTRAVGARRRTDELGLVDAELPGRLDRTLVGLVEHGDAGALGEQDAGEVATTARCLRAGRSLEPAGASVAGASVPAAAVVSEPGVVVAPTRRPTARAPPNTATVLCSFMVPPCRWMVVVVVLMWGLMRRTLQQVGAARTCRPRWVGLVPGCGG